MEAIIPRSSAIPPVRLAKTAVWIHVLGLLFLCVGIGSFLAIGTNNPDAYATLGVGGASWVALTLWSLLIAFRSMKRGETSGWRTVLWMTALLEISGIFLLMWIFDYHRWNFWFLYSPVEGLINVAFEICLPVLLPFAFVALCVALTLSKFLGRRFPRRNWVAWIILAQAVVVLPCVLLFYCVSTMKTADLRSKLASLAPSFIADWEESQLSRWAPGSETRQRMFASGIVSKERLIACMADSNADIANAACTGFQQRFPDEAIERAVELGDTPPPTLTANGQVRAFAFGVFLGRSATPAQLRKILDLGDTVSPNFRNSIFCVLGGRPEYIPDIIRFAATDPQYCWTISQVTHRNKAKREILDIYEKEWTTLFEQEDNPHRDGLAEVAIQGDVDVERLIGRCLNDPSVSMRRHSVCALARHSKAPELRRLLLKAFDDSDLSVRRLAVWAQAPYITLAIKLTPNEKSAMFTKGFTPAAPVPGEEKELEAVRAVTEKWLEVNNHK